MNKTCLVIMDGLGFTKKDLGNAVKMAKMKNLEKLCETSKLFTLIKASGLEVGLDSEKDPGNSEVGHNAIGSGQHIKQGLALLNDQFASGKIYQSDVWQHLAQNAKEKGKKLNVITLVSDGRLHSDIKHLLNLIEKCATEKIPLSIHAITDGRDVPTQSAYSYIKQVEDKIKETKANACIATVGGRGVVFMDRYESDTSWVTNGFELAVNGKGKPTTDFEKSFKEEYAKNPTMTDEQMPAFVKDKNGLIKNGDSVLLLNYRGDRALETCQMFDHGKYLTNEQYKKIDKCYFAGILQYDTDAKIPEKYLCPPPKITNTLTEYLCSKKAKQYTVTETVKFGHMTYYFNGNKQAKIDENLETWVEHESDKVVFDQKPLMQNDKITASTIEAINSKQYDFIKLNISSPDMVGHTGNLQAVITSLKNVDKCIKKINKVCKKQKVNLIITADHGNAEEMLYENGKPRSSHTNNLVPFVVLPYASGDVFELNSGDFGLTNIAATICLLMGLPVSKNFNKAIIKKIK